MRELAGDCAADPPLGHTARALAVARPDDVLYGLGALALDGKARAMRLRVRHEDARAALAGAVARLGAQVTIEVLPDAWPPRPPERARAVPAEVLVQAAAERRGRAAPRFVTVHGEVAQPVVLAARADEPVAALVARAGGARVDDWVAVAGGAPSGRLVERDAPAGVLGTLVLILPAGHEVVRRLKTPIADWLWRATSACEGCRACSEACARLEPHEVLCTLASLRDDGVGLAAALACTGCGVCDAVCPGSLSPRALVADVRDRMRALDPTVAPPARQKDAPGLDVELLLHRLGLKPYDRPVQVQVDGSG